MNITEECPELNYFHVSAIDNKSLIVHNYLVATFEHSLGLKSLASMGFRDVREIKSAMKTSNQNFKQFGLYLAETLSYYPPSDTERLKEDYFISKIIGLTQ